MFHSQLTLLREIFQNNGYPENFIDRLFKLFLNRTCILKVKVPTVEKKPLQLVLPYLGNIFDPIMLKAKKDGDVSYSSITECFISYYDCPIAVKGYYHCKCQTSKNTVKVSRFEVR